MEAVFGVDNTWDYNVYETESRIGDKIEFQTYTDKQENTLYLTSEEALWAKQDMVFIYNVLDTNEYSPQNNGKLFLKRWICLLKADKIIYVPF